jgi:transposase
MTSWRTPISRPASKLNRRGNNGAVTDEIRRLKRDLLRVTEERDILKKATAYFARESR